MHMFEEVNRVFALEWITKTVSAYEISACGAGQEDMEAAYMYEAGDGL